LASLLALPALHLLPLAPPLLAAYVRYDGQVMKNSGPTLSVKMIGEGQYCIAASSIENYSPVFASIETPTAEAGIVTVATGAGNACNQVTKYGTPCQLAWPLLFCFHFFFTTPNRCVHTHSCTLRLY